ncbi:MAG: DMT family transporter [Ferruginibacter sp.]
MLETVQIIIKIKPSFAVFIKMFSYKFISWFIFIALCFIWGSSFILMKEGMQSLSAYQVASIRIISSGLFLLPVAIKNIRNLPGIKIATLFLSGVLGSLLPAYLFCIAEQEIDSALAGTLNSLTPIFVILIGVMFFQQKVALQKIMGIALAFTGSMLLFFLQPNESYNGNILYVMYVVAATIMYGINVNLVHRYLNHLPSVTIAAIAFSLNAIPAIFILFFTGFFSLNFADKGILISTGFSIVLGVFGTAVASILFYVLIKRAGIIFSSMVTYGIPAVAIMWGLFYGEKVGIVQVLCLCIILAGVFVANYERRNILIKN